MVAYRLIDKVFHGRVLLKESYPQDVYHVDALRSRSNNIIGDIDRSFVDFWKIFGNVLDSDDLSVYTLDEYQTGPREWQSRQNAHTFPQDAVGSQNPLRREYR